MFRCCFISATISVYTLSADLSQTNKSRISPYVFGPATVNNTATFLVALVISLAAKYCSNCSMYVGQLSVCSQSNHSICPTTPFAILVATGYVQQIEMDSYPHISLNTIEYNTIQRIHRSTIITYNQY